MKYTETAGSDGTVEQQSIASSAQSFLHPLRCSQFTQRLTDESSGANMNVSFFVPDYDVPYLDKQYRISKDYYFLGNYAEKGSYGNPVGHMMLYKAINDSDKSCFRSPISFECIWSKSHCWLNIWAIIPPPGYVACGCIVTRGWDPPSKNTVQNFDQLKCVREDLCVPVSLTDANLVWNDHGSGAQASASVFILPNSGTAYAIRGYDSTTASDAVPSAH